MIKVILLIILCIVIYSFAPFSRNGENTISCTADVSYQWKQDRMDLLITQTLLDGKGVLSMSGILYDKNETKSYLSKTISFSYLQNQFFYYFRSELIMNSPQMTMSLSDQKKWLPDFLQITICRWYSRSGLMVKMPGFFMPKTHRFSSVREAINGQADG